MTTADVVFTKLGTRRQKNDDKKTPFSNNSYILATAWSGNPALPLFLGTVVFKPYDPLDFYVHIIKINVDSYSGLGLYLT